MFAAARLCQMPVVALVSGVGRTQLGQASQFTCVVRSIASQSRSSLRKVKEVTKGRTLKERLMAPAGDGANVAGKGMLAGASAIGLGALCFYGLGLSNEVGTVDKVALWSQTVRDRVKSTYMYFGGSLMLTAVSAYQIVKSPRIMKIVGGGGMMSLFVTLGAMMGTGMLVRALPYEQGLGMKQAAWVLHSAVIGAVVAPLTLLGGAIMIRAACYTAGIVGGLSTLAICAPSEKFLNMGGPLAMGLGVVFVSSIGTWFLPASTVAGAGLYSIAMYGGLALFGAFLLYDTQKIMKRAEEHPTYATQPYDPINNSVGIYMDTINIFIRVAMMLAGGNRKK